MKRFSSIIDKGDMDILFSKSSPKATLTQSYHIDLLDPVNMLIDPDGFMVKGQWGASPVSDQIKLPFIDFKHVHVRPTFRLAFRTQRCIIVADSYYAWKDSKRNPIRVYQEKSLLLMPAIYYKSPADQYGFTIVSRSARKSLREFSDNEPVLLSKEMAWKWLDFLPVTQVIKLLQTTLPVPLMNHVTSQKIYVKGFNSKELHKVHQEQVLLF